jgi:hypothetical protein
MPRSVNDPSPLYNQFDSLSQQFVFNFLGHKSNNSISGTLKNLLDYANADTKNSLTYKQAIVVKNIAKGNATYSTLDAKDFQDSKETRVRPFYLSSSETIPYKSRTTIGASLPLSKANLILFR